MRDLFWRNVQSAKTQPQVGWKIIFRKLREKQLKCLRLNCLMNLTIVVKINEGGFQGP
jgi:hypothetical protein